MGAAGEDAIVRDEARMAARKAHSLEDMAAVAAAPPAGPPPAKA